MIDGKKFFDQPVKNNKVTYQNTRKVATGQGDDYTTGGLLDYIYFKNYYKMIAVDLSKQQALDADPKAIQKNQFYSKCRQSRKHKNLFHLSDFSQGTVKVS